VGTPPAGPLTDAPNPILAGYEYFDGTLTGISALGGDYTSWSRLTWDADLGAGESIVETRHPTEVATESAADWIAATPGPWLAVLAYHAPHGTGGPDLGPLWPYGNTDPACARSADLACLATEDCADEEKAVYQGLVECLDLSLESLLVGMDPAVLDDTTVIFLGDNGTPAQHLEAEFDLPGRGKSSMYELGVRVPLTITDGATWRTGAAGQIAGPGRTSTATVHVVDLYATLVEDAFGAAPALPDSHSLVGCLSDPSPDCGWSVDVSYSESFEYDDSGALAIGDAVLRHGEHKFTLIYDPVEECFLQRLVNTDLDPFEVDPLRVRSWVADRLRAEFVARHGGTGSWGDAIPTCFREPGTHTR
jgi:hypothetical protein